MSTGIQWTDETWNPTRGCSRVSAGCENCYAEVVAARFSGKGQAYEGLARRRSNGEAQWTGKVVLVEKQLDWPLRWKGSAKARAEGRRSRIFVDSMSDLFHKELLDEEIAQVFAVMAAAHTYDFQILTKRPERQRELMSSMEFRENVSMFLTGAIDERVDPTYRRTSDLRATAPDVMGEGWPLKNVWSGTSVENQEAADERIPILLDTPAAVRFLSCEPLLGPIQFPLPCVGSRFWSDLHWVICGGESGSKARPCDVGWIRSIVAQCAEAKVPCFVKQMGKWITGDHTGQGRTGFDTGFVVNRWLLEDGSVFVPPIIGANAHRRPENAIAFGNCDTHGGNWIEWPKDLRVREFPQAVRA